MRFRLFSFLFAALIVFVGDGLVWVDFWSFMGVRRWKVSVSPSLVPFLLSPFCVKSCFRGQPWGRCGGGWCFRSFTFRRALFLDKFSMFLEVSESGFWPNEIGHSGALFQGFS